MRAAETPFGIALRREREARGLSQTALAERSNCLQSAISDFELGDRAPKTNQVRAIADALDIPVGVLFDEPAALADRLVDTIWGDVQKLGFDVVLIPHGGRR